MIRYGLLQVVTDADVVDIGELVEELSPGTRRPSRHEVKRIVEAHKVIIANDVSIVRKPIIGMATLIIIIPQLIGMRGRVEDVSRHPDYKGREIGDGLMNKLHEVARQHGIEKLELTCQPRRKGGNALYPRKGYKLKETNVYGIDLSKR
jgi:N-acetylglutamate synthase-like GNAT family acetyltransferase